MSSATVTPSLVTLGEPQPLSSTALRPRGPERAADGSSQFADASQQWPACVVVENDLLCHDVSLLWFVSVFSCNRKPDKNGAWLCDGFGTMNS